MGNVLIIGAGRSATSLIHYMLDQGQKYNWFVTVADADLELAETKVNGHPRGRAVWLDVAKVVLRQELISRADIVISLLPAHLHTEVAYDCLKLNKHLITASYVSQEMYKLSDEARSRKLIFMGEMGLDPGIDHMSTMQSIHSIRAKGGEITAFRSYAGGLVAPESDNNPWHYKFSWNPRNVVLAGQGTAQYLENNELRFIPYNRLFKHYKIVNVPGMGPFEAYPNRDSLWYRSVYGLDGIPSILRGTLRYPGFCDAWNALIQIGLTDHSYPILDSADITYEQLMDAFINRLASGKSLKERTAQFLGLNADDPVMEKMEWLGLFSPKPVNLPNASPALILEKLLLEMWQLAPDDKDMVVMQHEFEYMHKGKKHLHVSAMVMKGHDQYDTAMARLVGLPMAILAKLVILGKVESTGVHIPVMKEIYEPVLEELKDYGMVFEEHEHVGM